jgi:predicted outer membrane protein
MTSLPTNLSRTKPCARAFQRKAATALISKGTDHVHCPIGSHCFWDRTRRFWPVTSQCPNRIRPKPEEFINRAAVSGIYEVEAGKIALNKTQNAELKAFALTMVVDHTEAGEELKKVAGEFPVPSALDSAHQDLIARLNDAKAGEFDRLYWEQQSIGAQGRGVAVHPVFDGRRQRRGKGFCRQDPARPTAPPGDAGTARTQDCQLGLARRESSTGPTLHARARAILTLVRNFARASGTPSNLAGSLWISRAKGEFDVREASSDGAGLGAGEPGSLTGKSARRGPQRATARMDRDGRAK